MSCEDLEWRAHLVLLLLDIVNHSCRTGDRLLWFCQWQAAREAHVAAKQAAGHAVGSIGILWASSRSFWLRGIVNAAAGVGEAHAAAAEAAGHAVGSIGPCSSGSAGGR